MKIKVWELISIFTENIKFKNIFYTNNNIIYN